jgi:uncharacterized protein YpiB (UPF0302 family)
LKLGEEMLEEKIAQIFKDVPREKKMEESMVNRTVKQHVRDSLLKNTEKSLTEAFKTGTSKISINLDENPHPSEAPINPGA